MRSEPVANFQQNMIARSRAHGLIEDLEAIQVRQKQSVRSPGVPPRSHKRVLQPVKKQPAIGQPRERIRSEVSLKPLKRSKFARSRVYGLPESRRARTNEFCSRSRNSRRLGNPVSGS